VGCVIKIALSASRAAQHPKHEAGKQLLCGNWSGDSDARGEARRVFLYLTHSSRKSVYYCNLYHWIGTKEKKSPSGKTTHGTRLHREIQVKTISGLAVVARTRTSAAIGQKLEACRRGWLGLESGAG